MKKIELPNKMDFEYPPLSRDKAQIEELKDCINKILKYLKEEE